jgi:hypothetical protein
MCTLTYILYQQGYELFFNRDEQRTRPIALPPQRMHIDTTENTASNAAIYPVDPTGQGTWLAVNENGLSLALLNHYQASANIEARSTSSQKNHHLISRGQLILTLLKNTAPIVQQLNSMQLKHYSPFQLCVFPEGLCANKGEVSSMIWDGETLCSREFALPITSSSVDFDNVYKKRKHKFTSLVTDAKPTTNISAQHKAFHHSSDSAGKFSVNMHRDDAMTVSISHICVNYKKQGIANALPRITFDYIDNVQNTLHTMTLS